MELILFSIGIPLIVGFFHYVYIKDKSNDNKCILISTIASAVAICISMSLSFFSQVADIEVRNGQVISKSKEVTSCEHSYPCNCIKNSCSICYRHINDYNWVVNTNIPYSFTIRREDSQGLIEPKRWSIIKKGDPVSDTFTYVNYIKGSKQSLFNKTNGYADLSDIPQYPTKTYDYYNLNRVIGVGIDVEPEWNQKLQKYLSEVGPSYQINVVIVLTNKDSSFDQLLETAWNGGKKNDVIVVIHMDKTNKNILSSYIISWTPNTLFKVELRDNIMKTITFDFDNVIKVLDTQVKKNWERMHMEDYEYLNSDIDIPILHVIMSWLFSIFVYIVVYLYYNRSNTYTFKKKFNYIRR